MSKAFTKEEDDIPERSVRRRIHADLPPGAANLITADGLQKLRKGGAAALLESLTVVEPPAEPLDTVVFGSRVFLRDADGAEFSVRIVGVSEIHLHADGASWVSPAGRALLGGESGQRVTLERGGTPARCTIVRIEG